MILGYGYWQNQLGSDPDIIGKTLTLDDIPHVVVGIAPDHFDGHLGFQERQLFLPLERYPPLRTDTQRFVPTEATSGCTSTAACRPESSIAQASAAVSAVTSRLATQYPATNEFKAGIAVPYDPLGYRNEFRVVETLGLTLTGAVLLVVCLNISGMMQVRSAMRERELSIRQAIGASRGRLVQYLLSEAIVLAGLGAVLASLVLFNVPPVLSWLAGRPASVQVQEALRLDPSIVAICVGLCLVTSLVFGLLPATRFSRPVIISSLKDDAGVGGFRAGRVHRLTAALQVAIAVPLIVMSGISLDRVRATATADLGFASDLLYAAPLKFDGVANESVALRIRSVRDNLAQGERCCVRHGGGWPAAGFRGRAARGSRCRRTTNSAPKSSSSRRRVSVTVIWTRWASRFCVGRGFTHDDSAGAEMVTVISKTLADQLFPNAARRSHRQALDVRD